MKENLRQRLSVTIVTRLDTDLQTAEKGKNIRNIKEEDETENKE